MSGNPEEQPVISSQGIIKSYQAVGQEKKMADQAVKDFETNNPLEKTEERDYFGDRMMGYNDPEKAAEYKKLTDTQRQKTKEQKKIGAEYAEKMVLLIPMRLRMVMQVKETLLVKMTLMLTKS